MHTRRLELKLSCSNVSLASHLLRYNLDATSLTYTVLTYTKLSSTAAYSIMTSGKNSIPFSISLSCAPICFHFILLLRSLSVRWSTVGRSTPATCNIYAKLTEIACSPMQPYKHCVPSLLTCRFLEFYYSTYILVRFRQAPTAR